MYINVKSIMCIHLHAMSEETITNHIIIKLFNVSSVWTTVSIPKA